jgi:hypothetical protein
MVTGIAAPSQVTSELLGESGLWFLLSCRPCPGT